MQALKPILRALLSFLVIGALFWASLWLLHDFPPLADWGATASPLPFWTIAAGLVVIFAVASALLRPAWANPLWLVVWIGVAFWLIAKNILWPIPECNMETFQFCEYGGMDRFVLLFMPAFALPASAVGAVVGTWLRYRRDRLATG